MAAAAAATSCCSAAGRAPLGCWPPCHDPCFPCCPCFAWCGSGGAGPGSPASPTPAGSCRTSLPLPRCCCCCCCLGGSCSSTAASSCRRRRLSLAAASCSAAVGAPLCRSLRLLHPSTLSLTDAAEAPYSTPALGALSQSSGWHAAATLRLLHLACCAMQSSAAQQSTAKHSVQQLTVAPFLVGLLPRALALRHGGAPAASLAAPRPLLCAGECPQRAALPQWRVPHDKRLWAVRRAILFNNCEQQGGQGRAHVACLGARIHARVCWLCRCRGRGAPRG